MASAGRRPEHVGPPEFYYDEEEASKYTSNSHIMEVQSKISERTVELLALPDDEPCLLLDIGCGSGLSGETITEKGHQWIGVDISQAMLNVAVEKEVEGGLILGDMGLGLPFRPGSFDGAISVSALQWLCHANAKDQHPPKRIFRFFSTLYAVLTRGSRAALQFYPESSAQIELIMQQAMKAGFTGGLVVDYPNSTKAKKIYLVLFTGGYRPLPTALDDNETSEQISYSDSRNTLRKVRAKKPMKKSREWILAKKERNRKRGLDVRPDSKYTGRKRSGRF